MQLVEMYGGNLFDVSVGYLPTYVTPYYSGFVGMFDTSSVNRQYTTGGTTAIGSGYSLTGGRTNAPMGYRLCVTIGGLPASEEALLALLRSL